MENKTTIGIDISAKTLDACIRSQGTVRYAKLENTQEAITGFLSGFVEGRTVLGMENTGRYNIALYECLSKTDFEVYVVSPLHLKRSMGLVRGKDDRSDSLRICQFVEKHRESLTRWVPCPLTVQKVAVMLAERSQRVAMRSRLACSRKTPLPQGMAGGELERLDIELDRILAVQIRELEKEIEATIKQDAGLARQYRLMLGVPGVGKVLAWMMMVKTQGFTRFGDPRKMACYAGVVPFSLQSGTSLSSRPKVSPYADKSLKKVLHMAAMSAIRLDNDMGQYYRRKVAEGKNKMSVLNAVRNKIIHRIFAVLKRQEAYKQNLVLS